MSDLNLKSLTDEQLRAELDRLEEAIASLKSQRRTVAAEMSERGVTARAAAALAGKSPAEIAAIVTLGAQSLQAEPAVGEIATQK